jgi:zinc protease
MNRACRKCFALILLATTLAVAVAVKPVPGAQARKHAEAWRRRPPRLGPARPFRLPQTREIKLENGLAVTMIEDHRAPLVTIDVGVRVGSVNDPAGRAGLAEATAELLTEGAGSLTAEQLAREVETMGGRLESFSNDDYTEISLAAVSENVERMIEVVGDVLLRPTFAESEIALYKNSRIQKLVVQRQDPAFLVSELFNRVIYGPHPYAISAPTAQSVEAMDRALIESFYRANYTPAQTVVVIVGDFDSKKIESKSRAVFGAWRRGAVTRLSAQAMPERAERRVYLIDRAGSEQADFRVGNLAVARSDEDYFPLLVANAVLGAGGGSRLFLNIREAKGYAYDVSSVVNAPAERGTFFGSSQSRTEVTVAAIKEMLAEFDRLRARRVSAADLRNAKNYLSGYFSLVLSTQGGVADLMVQAYMLGLGQSYLENYRARIEAVTADEVQRAARKYILSASAAVVVVGDAAKLKRELEKIGPVEVFSVEGKPLE